MQVEQLVVVFGDGEPRDNPTQLAWEGDHRASIERTRPDPLVQIDHVQSTAATSLCAQCRLTAPRMRSGGRGCGKNQSLPQPNDSPTLGEIGAACPEHPRASSHHTPTGDGWSPDRTRRRRQVAAFTGGDDRTQRRDQEARWRPSSAGRGQRPPQPHRRRCRGPAPLAPAPGVRAAVVGIPTTAAPRCPGHQARRSPSPRPIPRRPQRPVQRRKVPHLRSCHPGVGVKRGRPFGVNESCRFN